MSAFCDLRDSGYARGSDDGSITLVDRIALGFARERLVVWDERDAARRNSRVR